MLTKKDFQKLEEKFATKEDKEDIKKDIADLKNSIIDFKDAILKEIKDMRDEVALVMGYKDQIEDHETRIEVVEKHLNISSPV